LVGISVVSLIALMFLASPILFSVVTIVAVVTIIAIVTIVTIVISVGVFALVTVVVGVGLKSSVLWFLFVFLEPVGEKEWYTNDRPHAGIVCVSAETVFAFEVLVVARTIGHSVRLGATGTAEMAIRG
jgi:hypothetical protein